MTEWRRAATCGNHGSCLEVRKAPNGDYQIRNSSRPSVILAYTPAEWNAFTQGILSGDFNFALVKEDG